MSKRDLKKYLKSLKKQQLEEQLVDLYDRFKEVKTYYDFVFNPKEEKLIADCKLKISNEYFPVKRKRPRMRRSIAQKYIKHFITIGVNPSLIADVMLFNIEVAQKLSSIKSINQEAFYKSMFTSFKQAAEFSIQNGLLLDFKSRLIAIYKETKQQDWRNSHEFENIVEMID